MFTKSKNKKQKGNTSGSTSEPTIRIPELSIPREFNSVYRPILHCRISGTKFIDRLACEKLGIEGDIDRLLDHIGWPYFKDAQYKTIARLTLEFLTTLKKEPD